MFPERGPGVALLLLRVSVAGSFFFIAANGALAANARWILPLLALFAILLLLGLLTPIISALIALFAAIDLSLANNFFSWLAIFPIVNAAALALLGPGAYSIDAWLFGRRVLVIPPESR